MLIKKALFALLIQLLIIGLACDTIFCRAKKKVVFVVGMHRSGTSAVTGCLKNLGLYLGHDLVGPTDFNLKGLFEYQPTLHLNNQILEAHNSAWDDIQPLKIDWGSPQAAHFKNAIKDLFLKAFKGRSIFGLKDPRLCLLLPLYLQAAAELGYEPYLVLVRRNSLEIAASLAKRNEMSKEHALALTKKYWKSAEQYAVGRRSLVIQFDELVKDTPTVVTKLKSFIPELNVTTYSMKRATGFVDKDLKHHNLPNNLPNTLSRN
jgi:hypothetical protein